MSSAFARRDGVRSWGRTSNRLQHVARPRFRDELPRLIGDAESSSRLASGLRRSYGDSCLNSDGALIDMRGLDRLIAFDDRTGTLCAESGASLSQILAFSAPRGWFLPTTPGTRFVTLGGAVANDVHGKNHHAAGSFGRHIESIGLLRSDGARRILSPTAEPDLFAATIGGLGLTGIIEWVELRLERIASAYLDAETIPYRDLGEFWALAEQSAENFEHTVAWIDCLSRGTKFGRGLFSRANWRADAALHAHDDRTWKSVPCDAPASLLGRLAIGGFNELYYRTNRARSGMSRQHYASYFYPLDALRGWNRLYGRRGMFQYQYQCVIPKGEAREAIESLLDEITRSGQASFLAVLKTFGELASPGLLSFPRAGATLALDFPNRGMDTLRLMSRLDAIVEEARGALYPAKDGRMTGEMFRHSFPRWREFVVHRDPAMSSDFWRRVSS